MDQISQEQMRKRYHLLPKSIQNALFDEKTADIIHKSCALRDAEAHVSIVARLTGRVLLGYLRPETFAFEIQKETGIDALKATQVAHDIDTEIFSGVRLELKKLYPPTIQTPTVQTQGFVRSQPVAAEPQKPAPRYIVPIPERFRKPETHTLKLETQNKEVAQPTPAPTSIPEQKPAASAPSPAQQTPPQPASPPMDPVVPLPTFIQSKFKQGLPEQLKKEEGAQTPSAQDALKSAFGKFTVSSTATEVKKEPASPYREPIEEPKKPAEQKPAAKTQGKVIDLSQF